MLGPAEMIEIIEVLNEHQEKSARSDARSPYLTRHFAVGMAMTKAAANGLKGGSPRPFHGSP